MRKNNKEKKYNNMKFEVEFYEKILEDRPNFTDALKVLAELYTKSGKHKKGLRLDQKLSELLPYEPTVFYNLACSYSLTGDIDNALGAIKKAIGLGYNDFNCMHNDPDLENLRKDRRAEEIFSKNINKK